MTIRTEPARIIGGPLDGATYKPVSRWPSYLTVEGEIMPTNRGDRIMRNGVQGRLRTMPKHWPTEGYILRLQGFPNAVRTYEYVTIEG